MKLTKEQQRFWDILKYPYKKTCFTCRFNRGSKHIPGVDCQFSNQTEYFEICHWVYDDSEDGFRQKPANTFQSRRYPSKWKWKYDSD